jgi:ParB-like chromosome segregation protein Spo0J
MKNWRDILPVHPAADLFPLMSEAELRELGEDIKANGLQQPVIVYDGQLLDGRNRLDAMALVGIKFKIKLHRDGPRSPPRLVMEANIDLPFCGGLKCPTEIDDPYAYVISANAHRRHLTAEQKRDTIAKLLKANPEASDRQIAKQIDSSPTTVGAVRKQKEASGDVSKLDTRKDTKGRKQPSTKPKKATAKLADGSKVKIDDLGAKAQAAIAAQQEITVEDRAEQMAKLDAEPEPVETHPAEEAPQGRVITKAELMPLLQAIISLDEADLHDGDLELYDTLVKARAAINHLCSQTVSKALNERARERRAKRKTAKAAAIGAKAAA